MSLQYGYCGICGRDNVLRRSGSEALTLHDDRNGVACKSISRRWESGMTTSERIYTLRDIESGNGPRLHQTGPRLPISIETRRRHKDGARIYHVSRISHKVNMLRVSREALRFAVAPGIRSWTIDRYYISTRVTCGVWVGRNVGMQERANKVRKVHDAACTCMSIGTTVGHEPGEDFIGGRWRKRWPLMVSRWPLMVSLD